jgi:N-acetylmuramoyl-L-alanine amidase
MRSAGLALLTVVFVSACRPAVAPTTSPAPAAVTRAPLPPVPLVEGPLQPKVVYPQANQMIGSRDSTFILGSVGHGRATLTINGMPVRVWPNGAFLGFVPNPPPTAPQYDLVAALGNDTARVTQPVRVAGMPVDSTRPLPPPPPPNIVTDTTPAWVILGDSASVASDTDRVIIGRPGPNGVYRWFLMPGTRVQLTGRYPGFARIRLDSALQIWVDAADAKTFAPDTVAPRRVAQNARVRSSNEWSDLIIPVGERPAYFVEEKERSIDFTLYDTRGGTDIVSFPTADSLIKTVEWTADRTERIRYTLQLTQQPFGYLVFFENNAIVLRVRRKPPVLGNVMVRSGPTTATPGALVPASALRGLTIVVDPGHPPAGATGPTALYEGDAVLPVGAALQRILTERGANVVLTRTTRDAVDLAMRPVIARRANGHAFVSLHYNAYGDGINPFTQRNGMEVYFYRPHSEPLARAVQTQMLRYIPLEDQGVFFRSLAVVRNTWMPSILVEGGFIIIPEQENAFRTPEFQERYARAVADGLENFFRGVRAPE